MQTLHKNNFSYEPINNELHWFLTPNELGGNLEKDIIRGCLNAFYAEGILLEILYSILVEHDGGGMDYFYWFYPDKNSPYPEDRFEGIKFQIGIEENSDMTVYITEQASFEYAKLACQKFMQIHPQYQQFLQDIINHFNPSR